MKFKILVVGNNTNLINDLFLNRDVSLDFITSSCRYDDIRNHVKYFSPDLFLYCMEQESAENAETIGNIRRSVLKKDIPVAIVCDMPEKGVNSADFPGGAPQLPIFHPVTAKEINSKILYFLNQQKTDLNAASKSSAKQDDISLDSLLAEHSKIREIEYLEREILSPTEKKRILVIDDSPNMLKLINNLLDTKYEVATAVSGKIALRFLSKKPVDLILLDYEMPEEDGPTVFQNIKAIPELQDIPVVFLTGINDVNKIQKALSLKPQGYLLKPIDQKKLLERISELID